ELGYEAAVLEPQAGTVTAGPEGANVLVLQARPIGAPVVQQGPFVANTREELTAAFDDCRSGRLGQRSLPQDDPVQPPGEARFARYADGAVSRPGRRARRVRRASGRSGADPGSRRGPIAAVASAPAGTRAARGTAPRRPRRRRRRRPPPGCCHRRRRGPSAPRSCAWTPRTRGGPHSEAVQFAPQRGAVERAVAGLDHLDVPA